MKSAVTFDVGMKQAVWMVRLQISGDAFWTEPSFVDRKIIARLKAYDLSFFDQQVHAALHGAVRAMRGHNPVNDAVCAPAVMRRVVQVRPELLNYLRQISDFAHAINSLSLNFNEVNASFDEGRSVAARIGP
jgi:hypothetical protein